MEFTRSKQSVWCHDGTKLVLIELPTPQTELLPGIDWGHAANLFTPAFWKYQVYMQRRNKVHMKHNLGRSLLEEAAVCMLGGYGMPAELGLAAFYKLKDCQLLDGKASVQAIEEQLSVPYFVLGKQRRYRFPRQKARYLAPALNQLRRSNVPTDAISLRDFLTTINGIGPKTASWIVRNHFGSDEVAILDIHIVRAGMYMGLYGSESDPARHYLKMERKFLNFCLAIEESASLVDAVIWKTMRRIRCNPNIKGAAFH